MVIDAQIDEMAGDKAAAEAKYRRAMALDKNGLRTTVAVAEGLMRLGKTAEADTVRTEVDAKFSDATAQNPSFEGRTAAVALYLDGTFYILDSGDPRNRFFTDLGFSVVDLIREREWNKATCHFASIDPGS